MNNKGQNVAVSQGEKGTEQAPAKVVQIAVNPLANKLAKVKELEALSNGYNQLNTTAKNLDGFHFNQEAEDYVHSRSNVLTIRDDEGKEFKTGNAILIGEVVKYIGSMLVDKMGEFEAKILAATV